MGAQVSEEWFKDLDVDLNKIGRQQRWKRPAGEAMQILQADAQAASLDEVQMDESSHRHDEPCIVTIPPPQPKQSPKAPEASNGSSVPKVEIIVRPGG